MEVKYSRWDSNPQSPPQEGGALFIRPHEQTVTGKCKENLTNDAAGTGGKFEKIAKTSNH